MSDQLKHINEMKFKKDKYDILHIRCFCFKTGTNTGWGKSWATGQEKRMLTSCTETEVIYLEKIIQVLYYVLQNY